MKLNVLVVEKTVVKIGSGVCEIDKDSIILRHIHQNLVVNYCTILNCHLNVKIPPQSLVV